MRTKKILLAALLLIAPACASSGQQGKRVSAENTYDCNYEQPTGSNMLKPVCRSEARKQEEQNQAQDDMRRLQILTPPKHP